MDLILFYYFSVLAEYKNFSVAAEEVYMSQSSLSKRIKSLEDKLGTELFIRRPRSIELTETGRKLLPYAQNISKEYSALRRDVSRLAVKESTLRIAATSFLSYYGITNQIADYMNRRPEVNISVKEMSSGHSVKLLDAGEIDGVIMFHRHPFDGPYDAYPLAEDTMACIVNRDHALAGKRVVTMEELCAQELILISEHDEPFLKNFVLEEMGKAGFSPEICRYKVWIGAIETILRQSQRAAVLPRRIAERMESSALVFRKIDGLPGFMFSLVTKSGDNKRVLHDFIKYLRA